jgi:all-trans-8'-apo-beta-carotenal 15,15'-oxygenase
MATVAASVTESTPPVRSAADWAGFFDTVTECDAVVTDIDGRLPDGLVGTLYRNGPGRRDFVASYFDGDGMIRALTIAGDGSVRYRARFIHTEKYLAERGSARPMRRLAGTNLPGGALRNMFRVPAHEANTSIVQFAGRLWALEEGGHPYAIDPDTLATGELTDFDGALHTRTAFTAHPHVDPATGDVFAFGTHFGSKPGLHTFRVDTAGRLHPIGEITLPAVTFVHDYGLSKRWMVFLVPPMVASLPRFLLGLDTFFESIRWRPGLGLRIALMSRDGGEPAWLETDPCMAGHVVSARDVGNEVVVDMCQLGQWSDMGEAAASYRTSNWSGFGAGSVWRYRIDPSSRVVRREEICELPAEFPRIDPRRECTGARWGYFAANPVPGEGGYFHALLKLDCHSGQRELFDFGPGRVTHEPVFVPRPGGRDEDDGWVVGFVHDAGTRATEAVIFDARRICDGPLCTLRLHQNAGSTFHGTWVPGCP